MQDRTPRWLTTAVAVVVLGLVVWSVLDDDPASEGDGAGSTATSTLADSTDLPGTTDPAAEEAGTSGLPVTFVDRLPVEARETLDVIVVGGPHPYSQDGSTFFNREGLLPPAAEGHYREFTVETPGSPDRGARRLVVGDDGHVFYTADHYGSFVEVVDAEV